MERGQAVKDVAAVKVWDAAKDKAEEEWEDHLPQGRAEIAYVRSVEQRFLTLLDSRVIKGTAQSAALQ